MPSPDIIEFVTDPQLLGLSISPAQETLLRGMYGLPLPSADHLDLWRQCTGRGAYLQQPILDTTAICGARAGKDSRLQAPTACYEAVFGGHEHHLAKGERGVIPIVNQDQRATRILYGYIREYLTRSPMLASLVAEVRAWEIDLVNGLTLMCFPCTMASLRGWSIPSGHLNEVAFFRFEGQADSDVEIQASIRRGMVGFPAPRLVKTSTPYMKGGILYEEFRRAWAVDDPDLLVWKAPTALMNPSIRAHRLERERRQDPLRYAREYEAEFAEDLDAFLPAAWVEDAVQSGRREVPPHPGISYVLPVDPSGAGVGGGADAFTAAVLHLDGSPTDGKVVHDMLRGWSRRAGHSMDLMGIVGEIATLAQAYGVSEVYGDKYGGQWVRQAFEKAGLFYRDADFDRSRAYLETEPLFAQGRIQLLDHPTLIREFKMLERRPRVGGRTVVDHPHGQHDDHANVVGLGAALLVAEGGRQYVGYILDDRPSEPMTDEERAARIAQRRQWLLTDEGPWRRWG